METAAQIFADTVRARIDALETNAFAVESQSGLPADAIRNVLRGGGKAGPTLNRAAEICAALGMDLYFGPPRDTGPVLTTEIEGEDFAAVPRYDAAFSAGPGLDNIDNAPAGAIAFRRDWLDREGIAPGSSMVVSVKGDSMAPTLHDGDLVLVDRRKTTPTGRRIYALIGPDGEARIKRVERLPMGLLLQSDNDTTPSELIPAADASRVRILGEVVWWGHTVRD